MYRKLKIFWFTCVTLPNEPPDCHRRRRLLLHSLLHFLNKHFQGENIWCLHQASRSSKNFGSCCWPSTLEATCCTRGSLSGCGIQMFEPRSLEVNLLRFFFRSWRMKSRFGVRWLGRGRSKYDLTQRSGRSSVRLPDHTGRALWTFWASSLLYLTLNKKLY